MDTCSWRVKDDDIRAAVLLYECVCEDVLHVAGVEVAVCYAVVLSIDLSILDSLRNVLDTDDLRCLAGYELSDSSRTCVEVVNYFRTSKLREFACYAVQLVSLLCVGLVEGFRSDLELETLHILVNCIFTFIQYALLVRDRVVRLAVDHVIK